MQQKLHALIAEDSEQDAALVVRQLRNGGFALSYERVESESAMAAALARQHWDIVLTDYSMPQFNAERVLALIAKSGLDIPCIVVSGAVGEETAAEVMRAGAHDLILKRNLKRLLPAITREIEARGYGGNAKRRIRSWIESANSSNSSCKGFLTRSALRTTRGATFALMAPSAAF
jgi:CheY-like chemotaxis protein